MLSVRQIKKKYTGAHGRSDVWAVNDISFDVAKGDFFTLLGPSGCGKSTTLQCIAGLETPDEGEITIGGQTVFSGLSRSVVPTNRRNIGMIFQSYAIWPHMTVAENVGFPLLHGNKRVPAADVRKRVLEMLDIVKLADYADRPAPHLSGGQQQRVALARALVHRPGLLLLDEPLSNLDAKLRETMRVELRDLAKVMGTTTVFVTHDQVEAMAMSDEIALLRNGRIVQRGRPRDIYLYPKGAFAADFMGRSNLLPGAVGTSTAAMIVVHTAIGQVSVAQRLEAETTSHSVLLVVRPQAIQVHLALPDTAKLNVFPGVIQRLTFLGEGVEAEITIHDTIVRAILDPYLSAEVGQQAWLELPPERCVVVADPNAPEAQGRPLAEFPIQFATAS